MTTEIFGVISIELSEKCFKRSITPELSDFSLIDKLIIIVIELYAVLFELFHTLKADTVILFAAWKLINLERILLLLRLRFGTFTLFEENKRHILLDCFFHWKMISGDIYRSSNIGSIQKFIILFCC